MSELPNITVIVCVSVADAPANYEAMAFAHEGSKYKRVPCPQCAQPMFLGSRSEWFLRRYPSAARVMCTRCAKPLTAKAQRVDHANFAQFMGPPAEGQQ